MTIIFCVIYLQVINVNKAECQYECGIQECNEDMPQKRVDVLNPLDIASQTEIPKNSLGESNRSRTDAKADSTIKLGDSLHRYQIGTNRNRKTMTRPPYKSTRRYSYKQTGIGGPQP